MYYHSSISSCYEMLALFGFRFVDKKLSLTTMVSFNLLQCNIVCIIIVYLVVRDNSSGWLYSKICRKLSLTTIVRLNIFQHCVCYHSDMASL